MPSILATKERESLLMKKISLKRGLIFVSLVKERYESLILCYAIKDSAISAMNQSRVLVLKRAAARFITGLRVQVVPVARNLTTSLII